MQKINSVPRSQSSLGTSRHCRKKRRLPCPAPLACLPPPRAPAVARVLILAPAVLPTPRWSPQLAARALATALAAAAPLFAPAPARADALTVATTEYPRWADAVAALQQDVAAQGHALHVSVHDGDETVPC